MRNYKLKRKSLSKIVANPNFIFRSQFWDDDYVYDNDDDDDIFYLLHLVSILCVRLIAKLFINITSFNTNNNSNTLY